MGRKRKGDGYNEGKYKEVEYFLKGLRAPIFKLININSKHKYICPICNYKGPFMDKNNRHHAKCPKCGELERARMAMLVVNEIYDDHKASQTDVLHISPENFLRKIFKKKYKSYISSDLYRKDVDHQFDIEEIPYPDNSFDLVFASHVLEYVKNDKKAINEIKRVLRSGGLAFLPVPMLHDKTIDFEERPPNKRIIRETGVDYFNRYREVFTEIKVYDPSSFNEKFNLTIDMEDESSTERRMYQLPNLLPVCKA
ncbi:class I SAM-dependent methyltransferase [Gammaproteobacteria bacterium]|jgi:SAM-dependent methyltransferase|nr:class I SAM-dependent methyltransferase [Gammaproteobacteria bacterium]MDC1171247.1 methyltransferase domain-containing protein [Gammaproteobacteria bacterium]